MENSQGNSAKPPMSRTTDGTAVAMIVESIATNAVESITAMRIGPRSDRSPTLLDVATRNLPARRPRDAAPRPRTAHIAARSAPLPGLAGGHRAAQGADSPDTVRSNIRSDRCDARWRARWATLRSPGATAGLP